MHGRLFEDDWSHSTYGSSLSTSRRGRRRRKQAQHHEGDSWDAERYLKHEHATGGLRSQVAGSNDVTSHSMHQEALWRWPIFSLSALTRASSGRSTRDNPSISSRHAHNESCSIPMHPNRKEIVARCGRPTSGELRCRHHTHRADVAQDPSK